MPLLADLIVECGRRSLNSNAIMLANQWGDEKNRPWSGVNVVNGTYLFFHFSQPCFDLV